MAFEWNDTIEGQAKSMWLEGLATAEIARRLAKQTGQRCTKGCVIGKAHRRFWPARPSPIKQKSDETIASRNKRILEMMSYGVTHGEVAARLQVSDDVVYSVMKKAKDAGWDAFTVGDDAIYAPPRVPVQGIRLKPWLPPELPMPASSVAFKPPAPRECCFPLGDPRSKAFRFCTDPTEPGRSYCLAHCRIAYQGYQPRVAA